MSSAIFIQKCESKLDSLKKIEMACAKKARRRAALKKYDFLLRNKSKKENSFWTLFLNSKVDPIPSLEEIESSLSKDEVKNELYGSDNSLWFGMDEVYFAELRTINEQDKVYDLMRLAKFSDEVFLTSEDLKWIE
jgi:hypothetical protein